MKLEGSLDAFSLPDIFQLLSFTKKTGGLHLASNGCDGVVFFTGGEVTGASADSSRQPLARRLIGAGAVDDEALSSAVTTATEGESVGVVKALLDSGSVDANLLQQAVSDQAVDAVFDLLRWQQGDFAFVVDESNPDDIGVTLAVESVLSDADSRRGSWESVSQVVPSPQAVLAMPVVLPEDPQVSREEWSLLALVDGRRSVAELVDLTGSGQYAVVSTLAGLVSRGLLEVRDDGDASADHVGVVVRRQGLLAPLEGTPFTPVAGGADEPAAKPAAGANGHRNAGGAAGSDVNGSVTDQGVPDSAPADEESAAGEPELVTASVGDGRETMLGGAHVPGDVVPPRPEPFLPKRQADFDDNGHASPATRPVHVQAGPVGDGPGPRVLGATAVALDSEGAVIERDPSVNRSLMLRLIAGVRGL